MSDYHHAGAFVVQFRTATDFECGRIHGRVEHVASGQTAHFESARDLLETFARLSKSTAVNRPTNG